MLLGESHLFEFCSLVFFLLPRTVYLKMGILGFLPEQLLISRLL